MRNSFHALDTEGTEATKGIKGLYDSEINIKYPVI